MQNKKIFFMLTFTLITIAIISSLVIAHGHSSSSPTTFDSSIEVTSIDTSKTTTASKLLTNPLTTIDLTLPKIEAAQIMIENNPAIYERYGGDAELLKLTKIRS